MRIKSKAAVKTVSVRKACATKKVAAPESPKSPKVEEKAVTFTLRADAGKAVFVAGSFNQWNPAQKKMTDKKNEGVYTASVKLAPGHYEYKFVVDGTWCADPENLDFVQNDHGTLNSVIDVK